MYPLSLLLSEFSLYALVGLNDDSARIRRVIGTLRRKTRIPVFQQKLYKGAHAICSLDFLGCIDVDEPVEITYSDGNSGLSWTGVHLENRDGVKIGDRWSSRNPTVVKLYYDYI